MLGWRLTSVGRLAYFVVNREIGTGASKKDDFHCGSECHLCLGCRGLPLVFLAVVSRLHTPSQKISAKDMALAQATLLLVSLCAFAMATACVGNLILRSLHLEMDTDAEHLLICAGVGMISFEVFLFGVEVTQQIRAGCFAAVGLLCIFLRAEFGLVAKRCSRILKGAFSGSRVDVFLLLIIGIVLSVEFLTSLAPLTGSDALHYHFPTQKMILQYGFHPEFSLSHSLLCGQHHLLILFGLALGSEQLAMGLIFLGGVLTALSLACLASRWSSPRTALAVTLLFLLTPVVFWQISSSGAPDIWMAFFASAAAIILCQSKISGTWHQVFLAGLLAGGIAGAKYTGCLIAAAFAMAIAVEFRSMMRLSLFFLASLLSGIWPYLRNLAWTGNPVFPFLSPRLSPHLVTTFALANLASDTGAASKHDLSQLFPFVFLAAIQRNSPGFYDFFGPTVLALAPLTLLAFRNTRIWRIPILVWFLSSLFIFFASGLPRFLLPVFPIALSCAAAGVEGVVRQKWAIASRLAASLLILMALVGAAGLAMYSQKAFLAAIGFVGKTKYLEQTSQDYEVIEALNRLLGGQHSGERTLVFVRHLYYFKIAYLNGDPGTSFEVDPERLQSSQEWKAFFEKNDIGYVVRTPDYPAVIAQPLIEMERDGDLVPFAQDEVQNFQGKRIDQIRTAISVVILRVRR
jgi:hypothetical protein